MATANILRACSRGSQCILFRFQNASSPVTMSKKTIAVSSQSMSALDYFRARRGPFSPEEKRGTGHMMMASSHWKIERVVMISMIPIMPACLLYQGAAMDYAISTVVFLHGYWGISGVLSDYVEKFVPWIKYPWYLISILTFAGLLHFNYNDVGVCAAIKMLWQI
ncbi:succinate dehydrogenase [ubiquinone] cytochrome b small subunit B, mitochondrial-like [Haliotis asinina]|uniref:succinate dehydrogenase [ubiquinone] cytochrome b small subunit B, mitochondrial-like n=1 Tax=Haliotis asinina TaxID=109174 RepID=UPI003531F6CF